MADLSITAANVGIDGPCALEPVETGEAITQGQPVYRKASDGLWYRSDSNASLEAATATGIALTPASGANKWTAIVRTGRVIVGATVAVGVTYYASATAGGIAPETDLATGWYPRSLGQAVSTTVIDFAPSGGTVARA